MTAKGRGESRMLASGHAAPEASTGLVLWRVTNAWQAAQRAALAPFGLTHVQFVLLASLAWLTDESADGIASITQQGLASVAGTDPMMTSQVVRVLEDRGLLVRSDNPHDRRAKALGITDSGAELVNRAVAVVERCDSDFFAPLGDQVPEFTDRLRALA